MATNPLGELPQDNHQAVNRYNHNSRADVIQWQCMNCGQQIFVIVEAEPPDTCEYCQDMTTWQLVEKP